MTARSCATCQWWMPAHARATFGTCRAVPPSVDQGQSVWPATDADEWCGAFRIAEVFADGRDARLHSDLKEATP